ncbi:hypothetical protein FQN57_001151 [Myotisia sp. PD_48]|nr:hypothetical protein FQN57_001151 [Myotisia sp. PD_48]
MSQIAAWSSSRDLRNHGNSPHHPKHDYTELALDVEAFIKDHNLQCPILIGHSMGAKTALTLALRSPDSISGVIAIDNGPVNLPLTADFPRYVRGMSHIESAKVKSLNEADNILKQYETDPSIRLFLLTNLVHEAGASSLQFRVPLDILASSFDALGDFPYTDPTTTQYQHPTLIIRALQSHYLQDDALPLIKAFFPSSTVVDFDCGHWVISEKAQQFREVATEFLRPLL